MTTKPNSIEKVQISFKIPKSILEEIDQLCSANYINRTTWFVNAARQTLKQQRNQKMEDILKQIAEMEK
jgi:metal-responsive CopG/Arc/MetJ family transcriptional regulator